MYIYILLVQQESTQYSVQNAVLTLFQICWWHVNVDLTVLLPQPCELDPQSTKKAETKNNMKQEQAFFWIFYVFRSTVDQLP